MRLCAGRNRSQRVHCLIHQRENNGCKNNKNKQKDETNKEKQQKSVLKSIYHVHHTNEILIRSLQFPHVRMHDERQLRTGVVHRLEHAQDLHRGGRQVLLIAAAEQDLMVNQVERLEAFVVLQLAACM
jgi:hypothetical protein